MIKQDVKKRNVAFVVPKCIRSDLIVHVHSCIINKKQKTVENLNFLDLVNKPGPSCYKHPLRDKTSITWVGLGVFRSLNAHEFMPIC